MAQPQRIELSTSSNNIIVAIDGRDYALLDPDEMSTLQLNRLQRQSRRVAELAQVEEPTEEQAAEMDRLIGETFRTVLPEVPDAVAEKLSSGKKRRVVNAFSGALAAAASDSRASAASPLSSASTAVESTSG